jgi:uncharacterized protein (TIGR03118 family)
MNQGFTAHALVADQAGAPYTDSHLVNGWGVAFNPSGFVWVADAGTASSTLYDGNGVPQSLVVSTPANPTGIVYNGSVDFVVGNGVASGTSVFIFATEGGLIAGWSPGVDPNNAIVARDGSAAAKSYKGLALTSQAGAPFLYATDFHNGRVDVFDRNFTPVTTTGGFVDPALPAGYAPFGIQAIGNQLFVSFAQQDGAAADEVAGPGLGIVDVFDSSGTLLRRLVSGGALNAPWGMAMAPAGFGSFGGALLVANFGDGKINAYNATTGAMLGTLTQGNGAAIVIDGLWGIAFGTGINAQPTTTLFYAAGPGDEAHGAYGRIDPP